MSRLPVWLFVSYGGGHVRTLLPVARRVAELGIAQPLYLALTTAAPIVREAGVPAIGFADLITDADVRARRQGEELASALAVRAADHAESVAYLGLSYVDLEQRLGPAQAAARYAEYGRQAFLPLGVLERAIRRFQPSLVVATNSPRAEQAALETARALDVGSACVVDMLGISERHLLCRPDYADVVCVINGAVRDALVSGGRPAADVVVTGNPAFDSVLDPAMVAQGAALRREAGWDRLHVCLYASSPEPASAPSVPEAGDPDLPRRIERALVRAVETNPALALWVRRHPSEPPAEELIALRHPRIRVSGADLPLHACLHACDEVIVTVSTVGLEASIAGRYVTRVRGSIFDRFSPFAELAIADRELAVDDLPAAYASLVPGALVATQDRNAASSGNATERVVAVLQSLVEGRHGG